jgi:hypothetical protein
MTYCIPPNGRICRSLFFWPSTVIVPSSIHELYRRRLEVIVDHIARGNRLS